MAITIKKRERIPETKNIRALAFIKFFLALAAGSIMTIWALYINSFVNNTSTTGIISSFLTLIAFISFFVFVPLIEKSNKGKLFLYSLILTLVFYALFLFVKSFAFFIILAIILTALQTIRLSTFGVIIKDKSTKKELSKNEGLIFTFLNLGYLLGPLIGGYVAARFELSYVFIVAIIATLFAIFIFKFYSIKDKNKTKKPHENVLKNFLEFFKNKERVISFLITGGASIWWILIYLFMPLFIIQNGLGAKFVGYFLSAVTLPLILTEYYFSSLTHKYGFKKIFKLGFLIPMIIAFICFFVSNIYVLMGLLVLASFGLAMLEPTSEAYFLSLVNKKQASKFYGPYYSTLTIGGFVGRIIPSLLLILLPFRFIFLVFSAFMLVFFFVSFKAKSL